MVGFLLLVSVFCFRPFVAISSLSLLLRLTTRCDHSVRGPTFLMQSFFYCSWKQLANGAVGCSLLGAMSHPNPSVRLLQQFSRVLPAQSVPARRMAAALILTMWQRCVSYHLHLYPGLVITQTAECETAGAACSCEQPAQPPEVLQSLL